jgi:rubrerythrin
MPKKGLAVWLFTSLTTIALIHLIEALSALVLNNPMRLFQFYPFIGEKLQTISPQIYLITSAIATLTLWGITCAVIFDNPVEAFLNKILSDAKKQTAVETQILENKTEILDIMNETLEMNNSTLSEVKDTIYSLRTEVKQLQSLTDDTEKIKTELNHLKKDIKSFEDKLNPHLNVCPACGKPVLPEFANCPYCKEKLSQLPEKVIVMERYK